MNTTARNLTWLGLALLIPAAAAQGLALPAIGVPDTGVDVATPLGGANAGASGTDVHADAYVDPALPVALPALPVALPDASADVSVDAGMDGMTAEAKAAGIEADAEQDTGFLQSIIDWFAGLF